MFFRCDIGTLWSLCVCVCVRDREREREIVVVVISHVLTCLGNIQEDNRTSFFFYNFFWEAETAD